MAKKQLLKRTVFIPVEGPVEQAMTRGDLSLLQEKVGGYIEHVRIRGADMWVNDNGRIEGLPFNLRASHLAGQSIVGDVVLTGMTEKRLKDLVREANAVKEAVGGPSQA